MNTMIARVRTEYCAPVTCTHPWVCERYLPEEDEYRVLSEHETERGAKAAELRLRAELPAADRQEADFLIRVRERRTHRGGWMVMVDLTNGGGYGYGGPDQNKPMTEAEAEENAALDRARIGVVDRQMMASSAHSVIVLRPCAGGRWTAAIGVGTHTRHVKGSHQTEADAEAAGRAAIAAAWNKGIAGWRSVAERAGIEFRLAVDPPAVRVLKPAKGVSAWDQWATAA